MLNNSKLSVYRIAIMDMSPPPRTNSTGSFVDSMYFQKVSPTRSDTVALSVESETDMIKYRNTGDASNPFTSPSQPPYLRIIHEIVHGYR